MKYLYNTGNKVCARAIEVELAGENIVSVKFFGGCEGNHHGIEQLVAGMPASEAIKRLSGITCGHRTTSCPDQLACALESIKNAARKKKAERHFVCFFGRVVLQNAQK